MKQLHNPTEACSFGMHVHVEADVQSDCFLRLDARSSAIESPGA